MDENKQLANSFLRFLSFVIDVLFWCVVVELIVLMISLSGDITQLFDSLFYSLIMFILLFSFGIPFINSFLISAFGGTVGKLSTGTRIVKEDTGNNLGFWEGFFRNHIGYAISAMLFWLGFIWILVDENKRGWHDMVVGSIVVLKNKLGVVMGIIIVLLLLVVNVVLIKASVESFIENSSFYLQIVEDIQTEIENVNDIFEEPYPEQEFDYEDQIS